MLKGETTSERFSRTRRNKMYNMMMNQNNSTSESPNKKMSIMNIEDEEYTRNCLINSTKMCCNLHVQSQKEILLAAQKAHGISKSYILIE